MVRSVSVFTMKSLFHVFRPKQGISESNPFSFLSSSTIHTSNQPIIRLSDLDYAFDCIENVNEAVSLFHYMLQMKPVPSISDYHKLFNVVVKMEHYSQAILMMKELSLLGRGVNEYFMNTLINCYAHLKEVESSFPFVAHFLKRGYPPDIVSFNCFIKGFFLKGNVAEAVGLFKKLVKHKCCDFDEFTITAVLDGLSKSGYILDAVHLLMISEKNDWKLNVTSYNTVMDGLFKSRMLKDGMELLNRMSDRDVQPDVVTYNIFLHGLCNLEKLEFARTIFDDLPSKGITPNVITYTVMIQGLCHQGMFLEAIQMLELMERVGCSPNWFTCDIIVQACVQQCHRHNIYSINLLKRVIGKDFPISATTFFLLLRQVKGIHQRRIIYDDDDVTAQLIQKLALSRPNHQIENKGDESILNRLIQKLIQ